MKSAGCVAVCLDEVKVVGILDLEDRVHLVAFQQILSESVVLAIASKSSAGPIEKHESFIELTSGRKAARSPRISVSTIEIEEESYQFCERHLFRSKINRHRQEKENVFSPDSATDRPTNSIKETLCSSRNTKYVRKACLSFIAGERLVVCVGNLLVGGFKFG